MNRRQLLARLLGGSVAIAAADIWLPGERSIFLPPKDGWAASPTHYIHDLGIFSANGGWLKIYERGYSYPVLTLAYEAGYTELQVPQRMGLAMRGDPDFMWSGGSISARVIDRAGNIQQRMYIGSGNA